MLRVGFVTLVATLLIGSLLYYTLHRSDMAESRHGGQQASQAAQQRAVAVSRVFASLSSAVLQVDAAKMQEFLGGPWGAEGLADAMLIDTGDRVLLRRIPPMSASRCRMPAGHPSGRKVVNGCSWMNRLPGRNG